MIDHKPIKIFDIILSTNKNKLVEFKNNDEFYLEDDIIEDNRFLETNSIIKTVSSFRFRQIND